MPEAQIVVHKLDGSSELVTLKQPRTLIGWATGDLRIEDPNIGSPHLELWLLGNGVWIRPIETTLVDGKPIHERVLVKPGQLVTFGSTAIRLAVRRHDSSIGLFRWAAAGVFLATLAGGAAAVIRSRPPPNAALPATQATAIPKRPNSLTQSFAWVRKIDGRELGGLSEMHLGVERGTQERGLTVSFKESTAGGTGNQWRAAAWLAAFTAQRSSPFEKGALSFTVQADDDVDGPSASLLMSVGFMSLLRGDPLRNDRIVSATVNPDGTAGPVGGLQQKIAAAKVKGKKAFAIPKVGKSPDPVEGIQIVPIVDLADAYEFMTGVALPQASPATHQDMELPRALVSKMNALTLKLCDDGEQRALSLEKEAQVGPQNEMLHQLSDACRNTVSLARKYQALGYASAALHAAFMARSRCMMGSEVLHVYSFAKKGQLSNALNSRLDLRDAAAEISKASREIDKIESLSIDQQLQKVIAYGQLSEAHLLEEETRGLIKQNDSQLQMLRAGIRFCAPGEIESHCLKPEIIQTVVTLRLLNASALAVADSAHELASLISVDPTDTAKTASVTALGADELEVLGDTYGSGGRAVMLYFDSLFTEQLAQQLGVSKGLAQARVGTSDGSYWVAHHAVQRTQRDPTLTSEARFASAITGYLLGASLVNRYFMTPSMSVKDTVARDEQLEAQLVSAREAALAAAGRASVALGFIPIASRIGFIEGRGFSTGGYTERVQALVSYWESALWSDLVAGMSARAAAAQKKP